MVYLGGCRVSYLECKMLLRVFTAVPLLRVAAVQALTVVAVVPVAAGMLLLSCPLLLS